MLLMLIIYQPFTHADNVINRIAYALVECNDRFVPDTHI